MAFMNIILSVESKKDKVKIMGLSIRTLNKRITKYMNTTTFSKYALNIDAKRPGRSCTFSDYWLPDLLSILQGMTKVETNLQYSNFLKKLTRLLIENSWLSTARHHPSKNLDFKALRFLNYKPLVHQQEFLDDYNDTVAAFKLRGKLLAAAPGTGKTATAIMLGELLHADRIIIISPLPAMGRVWENHIHDVYKNTPTYWLSTSKVPYGKQRIAVYHYEALKQAINDISSLRSDKMLLILDESHNFNNHKSLRSQLLIELINRLNIPDVVFASGTPIKALGSEMIVLLQAIDPLFKESEVKAFNKIFGQSARLQSIELLKVRLGKLSFKVEKTAIKLDAPNLIETVVKSANSKEYTLEVVSAKMKEYVEERTKYYKSRSREDTEGFWRLIDMFKKNNPAEASNLDLYLTNLNTVISRNGNMLHEIVEIVSATNTYEKVIASSFNTKDRDSFRHLKTLVKYPSLKVQGEALGRILSKERIAAFKEIALNLDLSEIIETSEKKTVIFSTNIEVCEVVYDRLKEYNPSRVYGNFTKNLNSEVKEFVTGNTNPMIATYASLSTAVPLISANTVILLNPPFRAYIQDQAISRVHRLGADTSIYVYECRLDTGEEPNLTTRGIDILKWSEEQVFKIMELPSIYTPISPDGKLATEQYDITIDTEIKTTGNILTTW